MFFFDCEKNAGEGFDFDEIYFKNKEEKIENFIKKTSYKKIVFDFSFVKNIDINGLFFLHTLVKLGSERNISFSVVNSSDYIKRIFKVLFLIREPLHIGESMQEALILYS